MLDPEIPEPEKRNCGRTGPTSPEGRATSSKNSIKHGSCAQTLILPCESEESWLLLLNRWRRDYQPAEDSLKYDFVLKTAQAEWHRIRAHRNFDCFTSLTQGSSPFNWTPDQVKKYDLMLRYKTAAERAFQREFRLLEQFCKLHRSVEGVSAAAAVAPATTNTAPDSAPKQQQRAPTLTILAEDPDSPTGTSVVHESFGDYENTVPRPYYPPADSPPLVEKTG